MSHSTSKIETMKATSSAVVLVLIMLVQAMGSGYGGYGGGSAATDNAVGKHAATAVHKSSKGSETTASKTGWDKNKVVGGTGNYHEKSYAYKGPDSAHDKGFKDHASSDHKATTGSHAADSTFKAVDNSAYRYPSPVIYAAPAYGYGTPGYGAGMGYGAGYGAGYGSAGYGYGGVGYDAGYGAGYGGY